MLAIVSLYMVAELVGGLLTNSLALLADAGHMLSDAAALALALFAMWIARRPSGPRHTYGYYRAEILAAVVNAATLVAVAVYIFIEAYRRIFEPPEVLGPAMMAIAAGGLVINLVSLRLLHGGKDESLNIRGAWLHVLTDALGSIGALSAGALIWVFGWNWADPLASVLIGVLVIYSGWRLLAEATDVLMGALPRGLDLEALRRLITAAPGVRNVHDLHVWTLTSNMVLLTAHVVVSVERFHEDTLMDVRRRIANEFDIDHITIQMETAEFEEERPPV